MGTAVTITSYNMLADVYCQPDLYTNCPLWALEWGYRRDRLMHQLSSRNSDFFCLQEVEKSEYENFWKVEMEKRGYAGEWTFLPAVRRRYTVKTRYFMGSDDHVDGCATFYNTKKSRFLEFLKSRFVLLSASHLHFNDSLVSQLQEKFLTQVPRGSALPSRSSTSG